MPRPPEAPLAFYVIPLLVFHRDFSFLRKSFPSILVSWIRRISEFEDLMISLSASSLFLLPKPLQFQEVSFIDYLGGSCGLLGGPWIVSSFFVFLPLLGFFWSDGGVTFFFAIAI